ncbi:MAG: hypothetical protein AAF449_05235 [Myxococcota bacterium]
MATSARDTVEVSEGKNAVGQELESKVAAMTPGRLDSSPTAKTVNRDPAVSFGGKKRTAGILGAQELLAKARPHHSTMLVGQPSGGSVSIAFKPEMTGADIIKAAGYEGKDVHLTTVGGLPVRSDVSLKDQNIHSTTQLRLNGRLRGGIGGDEDAPGVEEGEGVHEAGNDHQEAPQLVYIRLPGTINNAQFAYPFTNERGLTEAPFMAQLADIGNGAIVGVSGAVMDLATTVNSDSVPNAQATRIVHADINLATTDAVDALRRVAVHLNQATITRNPGGQNVDRAELLTEVIRAAYESGFREDASVEATLERYNLQPVEPLQAALLALQPLLANKPSYHSTWFQDSDSIRQIAELTLAGQFPIIAGNLSMQQALGAIQQNLGDQPVSLLNISNILDYVRGTDRHNAAETRTTSQILNEMADAIEAMPFTTGGRVAVSTTVEGDGALRQLMLHHAGLADNTDRDRGTFRAPIAMTRAQFLALLRDPQTTQAVGARSDFDVV